MIKRLLLLTLFTFHATSYCTFEKLINAVRPFKQELTYVSCGAAVSGIMLTAGGYYWGSTRSKAALARDTFNATQAKIQKEENERHEKERLAQKEKQEREAAIKLAALQSKQAADSVKKVKEIYHAELGLIKDEKLNPENRLHLTNIILSNSDYLHFKTYNTQLKNNIDKLAQLLELENVAHKQEIEVLHIHLSSIAKLFNLLFSNVLHEEARADQKEKYEAEIKILDVEHARLKNQKLRDEHNDLVELKRSTQRIESSCSHLGKIYDNVNSSIGKINVVITNFKMLQTFITQKIDMLSLETQKALHTQDANAIRLQSELVTQLQNLKEAFKKFENTNKELLKLAENASKSAQATHANTSINPAHQSTVSVATPTQSVTTSAPTTSTEQTPPPTYDGYAISKDGIQAIPVPN